MQLKTVKDHDDTSCSRCCFNSSCMGAETSGTQVINGLVFNCSRDKIIYKEVMTLTQYVDSILKQGGVKELRIYNSPIGLISRAELINGDYRKEFIESVIPTIQEMSDIGNNGFLSFMDPKAWNSGDKLRHKNSFNSVFFIKYTNSDKRYFYHEESGVPLMSKHYVKAPGDNK